MSLVAGVHDVDRKDTFLVSRVWPHKRPADVRNKEFKEIYLEEGDIAQGFSAEEIMLEASRCIQCPNPQGCHTGCPTCNDVPEILWQISKGNFIEAAKIFADTSAMPEILGRICPNVCQKSCVLEKYHTEFMICRMEAYVCELGRRQGVLDLKIPQKRTDKKVAVVGSGPAGLTVAHELGQLGHEITVFEMYPKPGGTLMYGVPCFKLEKEIIWRKVRDLERIGVQFRCNTKVGEDPSIYDLLRDFDAVFLGTGACIEASTKTPGEDLEGVYSSTKYLIKANLPDDYLPKDLKGRPKIGDRVIVVGGGDTAVDCARSSVRLGAKDVRIVYRRTEREMPGNPYERHLAKEEGVRIDYLAAPVEFIGDGNGRLKKVRMVQMELGAPDASGRRRPVPIEGSEENWDVDNVIMAVGYWNDPYIMEHTPEIKSDKWGQIEVDWKRGITTMEGVFAAGDNVFGPDLVVTACGAAKNAARNMANYLAGRPTDYEFRVGTSGQLITCEC